MQLLILCLFGLDSAGTHRLPDISADCPVVGLGPLASDRQPSLVPDAPVASDFLEALDVISYLMFQLALELDLLLDEIPDLVLLGLRKILRALVGRNLNFIQNFSRGRITYSVDISERYYYSFFIRDVYPCDSKHIFVLFLTLTLLMFRIRTNDKKLAFSLDRLAFVTNFFH